jgi:transketolase
VYSMPLWSMADKAAQIEPLRAHEEIVTLEDHLQDGGFGSWMLEAKAQQSDIDSIVRPVALTPEVCGTVGSQATLNRLGGLLR